MIFSAATFLYLLPLAGLPILFHLVLKQKKRKVVFSTLMFFYRADPRLNSRREIRQWLLLLVRVLMIALLLLALSRPSVRLTGAVGGKLSVVAVVDNSGSMSAASEEGGAAKLERATAAARRLFASLPDSADGAIVLLVDDPAVSVPEALTTDRDALFECLDAVRTTEATGRSHRALSQAFQFLRDSTAGGGVVHVFTDLQEAEWGKDSDRFDTDNNRVSVVFHKIDTAPRVRANVAVAGVQYPERHAFLGQPYDVGLVLRNDSDSVANVRVHSLDAHGERTTESVTMSGHQVRTVRIPITIREPGHHWVRAWVEGDDFAADNAAGIGLSCAGLATVRFAGRADDYGVLPVALSPSGKGQLTGLVTQFGLPSSSGRDVNVPDPVLMVTTWDRLGFDGFDTASLRTYVEEGGNLLIAPSARQARRAASGRTPAWLGADIRARESYPAGVRLQPVGRDTRFWHEVGKASADITGARLAAYAFHPLDLSSDFTPVLRAGPDRIVLAYRPLGHGNIFVSGTAFSPRWNTLPLSGLGVVMTQYMAAAGTLSPTTNTALVIAGEQLSPPAPVAGEVEIISLVGDAMEWKGRPNEMPVLPRTGVYLMKNGDAKYPISVRASEKEGEYRFVEGTTVSVMGPLAHTVASLDADVDFAQYHRDQARALGLFVPLLLLATLALFVEGLLGTPRTLRTGRDSINEDSAGGRLGKSGGRRGSLGLGSLFAALSRSHRNRETGGGHEHVLATGGREA